MSTVAEDSMDEPVLDEPRHFVEPDTFLAVAPKWWLSNFGGMVVYGMVAARSRSRLLRRGFRAACALHVIEALYAYDRARRAGFHTSASRWGLQTLALGFPSLAALNRAIADAERDLVSAPAPARR